MSATGTEKTNDSATNGLGAILTVNDGILTLTENNRSHAYRSPATKNRNLSVPYLTRQFGNQPIQATAVQARLFDRRTYARADHVAAGSKRYYTNTRDRPNRRLAWPAPNDL